MPRYLSIDILRGVAILMMVQVHFVENLSFREASSAWLYDATIWLGFLPAPLFTIVSGMSFGLWVRKLEAAGRSDADITHAAVRRGFFLFALGIVFNVVVWLPDDAFNWDVLTLIGVSLGFLAYARKLPLGVLVLICVAIVVLSPPLRVVGDYPEYWDNAAYEYDWTIRDVAFGFFANGYFPLFPWLAFPLAGFILGEVVFPLRERPLVSLKGLGAMGLLFMAAAALGAKWGTKMPSLVAKHYTDGLTMYPASTLYVFALFGFAMFATALLHRDVDGNPRIVGTGPVFRFLRLWSSYSLTIYIVHHIVHLSPLWLYAVLTGRDDAKYYWRSAMSAPAATALAFAFIVVMHGVLLVLDRHRKFSIESAMRWICD